GPSGRRVVHRRIRPIVSAAPPAAGPRITATRPARGVVEECPQCRSHGSTERLPEQLSAPAWPPATVSPVTGVGAAVSVAPAPGTGRLGVGLWRPAGVLPPTGQARPCR